MKSAVKRHASVIAAGWLFSSVAFAQYAPDATMDLGTGYGNIALSQSTLDGTRAIDTKKKSASSPEKTVVSSDQTSQDSLQVTLRRAFSHGAPTAEPPAAAIRTLSFVPDPAVTAREQDRIVAYLDKQPGGAGRMEKAIRSGKLLGEFDRLLSRYHHSPDNLGDVLAAYLIMSWEIVNDRDSTQVPAGQRAVRRQLIAPLAALPRYAAMSDAQKQAQAERTAYMTMIAATAYQSLKRGGDRAQLAWLQRSVRDSLMASGIDLRRLQLTDGGLVAR